MQRNAGEHGKVLEQESDALDADSSILDEEEEGMSKKEGEEKI